MDADAGAACAGKDGHRYEMAYATTVFRMARRRAIGFPARTDEDSRAGLWGLLW